MKPLKMKRFVSTILSFVLIFSFVPVNIFAKGASDLELYDVAEEEYNLSNNQTEAYHNILELGAVSGLYGFEDVSLDSDEPIQIFVEFNHLPIEVANALERAAGNAPVMKAETYDFLVQSDREIFQEGLERLFAGRPGRSAEDASSYEIIWEYNVLFNAVAMRVPANMVPELLKISSVRTIYYDEEIVQDAGVDEPANKESIYGNPYTAEALEFLNVQAMHEMGIKGQGVLIGVIDDGIDFNHPDLQSAFLTYAPDGDDSKLMQGADGNMYYYGRNFFDTFNTSYEGSNVWRPMNNPYVTSYDDWFYSVNPATGDRYPEVQASNGNTFYRTHGTHVAGIIAARGVNEPYNALGVAPEAKLVAYRTFGVYGNGPSGASTACYEQAALDGCDIVTYSGGSSQGEKEAYYPVTLAMNYLALTYDIVILNSAGNSGADGLFSLSSPSPAPMITAVGNAIATGIQNVVTITYDGIDYVMYTRYRNYGGRLEPNDHGTLTNTYPHMKIRDDGKYDVYIMPNFSGDQGSGIGFEDIDIGTGSIENWEAAGSDVAGKIVVIARGASFAPSYEQAIAHGAGGVIMINHKDQGDYTSWSGEDIKFLPYYTLEYYKGIELIHKIWSSEDKGVAFTATKDGNMLSSSSSRGPVNVTYDIKPDFIAPGSGIVSTVPYWASVSTGRTEPLPADYTNAYAAKSGTSMSCPYGAGLYALLLCNDIMQNGREESGTTYMKPVEAKARLMNTADMSKMDPDISYTVFDIGAGRPNIEKAINAEAYVTVKHDNVFKQIPPNGRPSGQSNGGDYETVSGDVASFSFGCTGYGEAVQKTLTSTVHNTVSGAKTFEISAVWNTPSTMMGYGDGVKNKGDVDIVIPETVSVAGHQEASFDVTVSVPATLTNTDKGSYEGYIYLTNTADKNEVYGLPFAIYVIDPAGGSEELEPIEIVNPSEIGKYIRIAEFYKPVISTNPDSRQFDGSSVANFYYSRADAGGGKSPITQYHMEVYTADAGGNPDKLIGYAMKSRASMTSGTPGSGTTRVNDRINGVYYDANGASVTFQPGAYLIRVIVFNADGDAIDEKYIDFYVDNDAPEITITNRNVEGKTLSGEIYDFGIEDMRERGIRFEYIQSACTDAVGGLASYQKVMVVGVVNGSHYAKTLADPDGAFTLDLSRLYSVEDNVLTTDIPIEAETQVELYAIDQYHVKSSASNPAFGFDINNYMFTVTSGSSKYSYFGANKTVMTVLMEDSPLNKVTNIISNSYPEFSVGDDETALRQEIAVVIEPETASDKNIVWTVSGTNAEKFELYDEPAGGNAVPWDTAAPNTTVYLGIKTGEIIVWSTDDMVTATANDGSEIKADIAVTIQSVLPDVESISVGLSDLSTMNVGTSQKLTVTIDPIEAADFTTLTWTSSNENILTVDGEGVVKAVATGSARITVAAPNGVSHTIIIRVTA